MVMNPFKPTAGKMPPILIGRQSALDDFTEGLDNGVGAPGRIMMVTGQRGFGKTVLLTEFRRIAAARRWETIAETAAPGVAERLVNALTPTGLHVDAVNLNPSISLPGMVSASLGQARFSSPVAPQTLRNAMTEALEAKKIGKGKGILITIDETQAASREDLVAIAVAVQHITTAVDETDIPDGEKKGVAIVFAGLPSTVNGLINDRVTTFLRRALQCELTDVPLVEVKNAFMQTVSESGKFMSDADALTAAQATGGYPYMIQLVGYYMWQAAQRRGSSTINLDDVNAGISDAVLAFDDAVCAPAMDGLSGAERTFVSAMAEDAPEASNVADIETRTRRSRSWVNKYRAALIENRIIRSAGYGLIEFVIPHFGMYLKSRRG